MVCTQSVCELHVVVPRAIVDVLAFVMSLAPGFSVPSGRVEDRRVNAAGIGKYRLVSGLSMSFQGTRYIVLASLNAPNDYLPSGNPIEMTIAGCPGVPEDTCT